MDSRTEAALRVMTETQRKYYLDYLSGLTVCEIARKHGKKHNTISAVLKTAKKRAEKILFFSRKT